MSVPRILKDYNCFLDGLGKVGLADEITLPTLELTTEDHRAGGMDVPIALDLGMEALELSVALSEHDPEVFKNFGKRDQNGVSFTFLANMVDDTNVTPYRVKTRGMIKMIEPGTIQTGQKNPLNFTMRLRYYELAIGNEELIAIDADNFIRRIDGVDVLAERRANLGL
jgi:uncharacterized protein